MQRSACHVHVRIFTKSSIISDVCREFVHFVQAIMNRLGAAPRLSRSVSHRPLAAETRKQCQTGHVGFMVNKVELGQVFLAVLIAVLSVSFHQCPKLNHSSVADGIQCYQLTGSLN